MDWFYQKVESPLSHGRHHCGHVVEGSHKDHVHPWSTLLDELQELDSIHLLFSEDAEVQFEGIGSAQGRSEIEALYREVVGGSPFIKQFIHNHVIRVEGDTATGLSYLDARTVANGESLLVAARFDDEYVRQAGEWKFRSLALKVYFAVPVAEGWAEGWAGE